MTAEGLFELTGDPGFLPDGELVSDFTADGGEGGGEREKTLATALVSCGVGGWGKRRLWAKLKLVHTIHVAFVIDV